MPDSEVETSQIINENQMEIKRTTDIFIETKRRFVIRGADSAEEYFCPACSEALLGIEAAAALFGISQLAVFRLVEQKAIHFAETETGAVMICPASLAAILSGGKKQLIAE